MEELLGRLTDETREIIGRLALVNAKAERMDKLHPVPELLTAVGLNHPNPIFTIFNFSLHGEPFTIKRLHARSYRNHTYTTYSLHNAHSPYDVMWITLHSQMHLYNTTLYDVINSRIPTDFYTDEVRYTLIMAVMTIVRRDKPDLLPTQVKVTTTTLPTMPPHTTTSDIPMVTYMKSLKLAPHGGGANLSVRYNDRLYIVRLDRATQKFICVKKVRVYLKNIRGRFRYA